MTAMWSLHFPDDAAVSLRRDGVQIAAAIGRDRFDAVVNLWTSVLAIYGEEEAGIVVRLYRLSHPACGRE